MYQLLLPIVPVSVWVVTGGSRSSFATILTLSMYQPSLSFVLSDMNRNRMDISPPIYVFMLCVLFVHCGVLPGELPVIVARVLHVEPALLVISRIPESPDERLCHVEKMMDASKAFERSIVSEHAPSSVSALFRLDGYVLVVSSPHHHAMLLELVGDCFFTSCHQSPALCLSMIHLLVLPCSKLSLKKVVVSLDTVMLSNIHPLSVIDWFEKNLNLILVLEVLCGEMSYV